MTSNLINPIQSWNAFVDELQENILPIYMRHEENFDILGIHGRMHICRAVLFAEYMARFYKDRLSIDIDFYAIRVATAFHDSGRQGSGLDLWEDDSARNCDEYVLQNPSVSADREYAQYVGNLIKKRGRWDIAKRIVHDADVLEIMRPCCGHGGIDGFRRRALRFAGNRDPLARGLSDSGNIRESLIQEAWRWIQKTESMKRSLFNSSAYMAALLEELDREQQNYPILSTLLSPPHKQREYHD